MLLLIIMKKNKLHGANAKEKLHRARLGWFLLFTKLLTLPPGWTDEGSIYGTKETRQLL